MYTMLPSTSSGTSFRQAHAPTIRGFGRENDTCSGELIKVLILNTPILILAVSFRQALVWNFYSLAKDEILQKAKVISCHCLCYFGKFTLLKYTKNHLLSLISNFVSYDKLPSGKDIFSTAESSSKLVS